MTRNTGSPRITDHVIARHTRARPAAPHTTAELNTITTLLRGIGAHSISVGHGRERACIDAAQALAEAWEDAGDPSPPSCVLGTVDWPATAASWLRPARRLLAGCPDAWVIADTPIGFAQLARRLAEQPGWSPSRTFAFANLADPDLIALADPDLIALAGPDLAGLSGAIANGDVWHLGRHTLVTDHLNSTVLAL
ncbi:MAG: ABC transporter substrate-binding protein [Actinomycetota bacterium]|nr:ABC transporter substrate-binding protein [Actinomycetota bacterium]